MKQFTYFWETFDYSWLTCLLTWNEKKSIFFPAKLQTNIHLHKAIYTIAIWYGNEFIGVLRIQLKIYDETFLRKK